MITRKKLKERAVELAHVYFFNSPGADNTARVTRAVKRRIRFGDVDKILVASESGRLALAFGRTFPHTAIVCVTYDERTRREYLKPALLKSELLERGVIVVDRVPEPLTRQLTFRNWWERKTIRLPGQSADLFWMTLICVGGHGLRTAVEIVFMAVQAAVVPVGERVVSVAGTGWGADSAIVMRASKFEDAVGEDPAKRVKIEEILAGEVTATTSDLSDSNARANLQPFLDESEAVLVVLESPIDIHLLGRLNRAPIHTAGECPRQRCEVLGKNAR